MGRATNGFVIKNEAGTAKVYLLADIGGYDGIKSQDFVPELMAVKASDIELHINSNGGDVHEGIAIYNALRDHPAEVTVHVDGVAASAASFIAMAGDQVIMNRGSTMMIHDAMTIAMGNAAAFREAIAVLDQVSNTIAELYADRAGGSPADWRKRMKATTWYNASEAVAAGLADVATADRTVNAADKLRGYESAVLNSFKYKSRDEAPAPEISNKVDGTDTVDSSHEETEPTYKVDLSALRDALKEALK